MWDLIHTEYDGPVGYSLTIVFYFACCALVFVFAAFVVLPLAKSMTGHHAEVSISRAAT